MASEKYINYLLDKISVIGVKYLPENEKEDLEKISKGDYVDTPKYVFAKKSWSPDPTPAPTPLNRINPEE